ncbi:MAG TPA: hypothetical protein VKP13_00190 [Nitrospira sp.]|nr:hypothetical protein [Nitrospira sp.]
MGSHSTSATTEQLEQILCGLIRREGTVTFSSLANMCPQYRWVSLFKALHNLEKQRIVTLTPLPWDYAISALGQPALKPQR